eukprot:m.250474 g.250474  ORF g.250474 m.250474 type:complete len:375 (-) comp17176_c0_seq5:297-1421(-)
MLLACLAEIEEEEGRQLQQLTVPNSTFSHLYSLQNDAFRRTYRLTTGQFERLLIRVAPHIRDRRCPQIALGQLVGAVLWWLAHGTSLQAVQDQAGISRSVLHQYIPIVCYAIYTSLENIQYPQEASNLQKETLAWCDGAGWLHGCITAGDGTYVPFTPLQDEAGASERWRCRKGFTAMNVIICCGANLAICDINSGFEGSAHDAFVVDKTGMTDRIPQGYFGLFDSAMRLTANRWLTPFRKTRYHMQQFRAELPRSSKELFNWQHAKRRVRVERTIGLWKGRFKILRNGITMKASRANHVIFATAALHNFILNDVDDNDVDELDVDEAIQQHRLERDGEEEPAPKHCNPSSVPPPKQGGAWRDMLLDAFMTSLP